MAMADGSPPTHDADWERIKALRRFRELFHGRFTDAEGNIIMRHTGWSAEAAVGFVLQASQDDINSILDENSWQVVTRVRRNTVLRDIARRNEVGAEIRQFTCQECDNMWWRKVPTRKPVARCHLCREKFDPLARNKEFGLAKFVCACGNAFRAFGAMDVSALGHNMLGKSKCMCYSCMQNLCEPVEILPPFKGREREDGRARHRYTHKCTAYNCYKRYNPLPGEPVVPVCVHPNSLEHKVIEPSSGHVSTGSTVKTFLTQDELAPPHAPYEPSLASIPDFSDDDNA
ncbi:shiftless antiviral inhibitor of ribosomal frameshifting protein homolog [Mya arenaria]|uniref:shiftless antiviral inhibitor of ribosomal frameshifting protein homolog n=1 Tax=Mya arenaria TaxID=6604 RepID=UPI0022E90FB6|nr:shiftless antiviral inhibitor of ribosomal frameshifting protein homolog [Mya arenaria]XP_052795422.1 shiftless antiviral inhibitor of ribosomal frameshifting protein homolog [Mya arenaria]XP_052795423.1 shiftless antiviral inhibitor of ribosomal frameshifting protein homolog [Mya arenaria]